MVFEVTAGNNSEEEDKATAAEAHDAKRVNKTLLEIDATEIIGAAAEKLHLDPESVEPSDNIGAKADSATAEKSPGTSKEAKTLLESKLPSLNQINESERLHPIVESNNPDQQPIQNHVKESAPRRVAKTLQEPLRVSTSNIQAMQDPRQSQSNLEAVQDPRKSASKLRAVQDSHRPGMDFAKPDLAALQAAQGKAPDSKDAVASKNETKIAKASPLRAMSKQNIKILKKRKISNTMVDVGLQMQSMEPLHEGLSVGPSQQMHSIEPTNEATLPSSNADGPATSRQTIPGKPMKRQGEYVPKTMLDHNMLFKAVESSALREEAKMAAEIEERAKLPFKPKAEPIKADRTSAPCPFKWEETESSDKYKFCTKCQMAVYNLNGMERPEAEALIFKRENKSKFVLFGREDGKFSTADCPEKAQRQKALATSVVVGVVLIAGAVALLMLLPQQQPTMDSSPGVVQSSSSKRVRKKSVEITSGGTRLQTFQFPEASQNGTGADGSSKPHEHDPDEDGSFWRFDNSP